jgi:YHS domain-containing protein
MTAEIPETESKASRPTFVALCGRVFRSDPEFFPQAEYRGCTIYLCTEFCLDAFLSDPDRFVAAHKKKRETKGETSITSEICPLE